MGVDIPCRMKMTVLDIPMQELERHQGPAYRAIEAETRFGIGASFKHRRQHEVLDADWMSARSPGRTRTGRRSSLAPAAAAIISSSSACSPPTGRYCSAGLQTCLPGPTWPRCSHSGSRGTGAAVCDHYSKIAFSQFRALPSALKRMAWLSLDSQEAGRFYARFWQSE